MKTKSAVEYAAQLESAANEVRKVRSSRIADTFLNTMTFTPIFAMRAALILDNVALPYWVVLAISVIPALFMADLIVSQMISEQINSENYWDGWQIDAVSIGLSFWGLSLGMFSGLESFVDVFTVENIVNLILISLLSVAPVMIIRSSVRGWKTKLMVEVETKEGEVAHVYGPHYINSKLVAQATQDYIKEAEDKMKLASQSLLGRVGKRLKRSEAKLKILKAS